jgi:hypothetical protein
MYHSISSCFSSFSIGNKVLAQTNLNSKFGNGSGISSSTIKESQNLNLAISIAHGSISTQ